MKLSSAGLDLIVEFEGKHRKLDDGRYAAYRCPANVWTIYAGCTEGVREGMVVDEAKGREMFLRELAKFEAGVTRLVTVELNQNQYDACVSLAYNIGLGAFERSTVLRRINARDFRGAASAFKLWNRGGGRVLRGLVNRRAREATLFLTPVEAPAEPDMPQAVEPSPEPPSKTVVATVSAGGGAMIPAVPAVLTDNAANASSWQAAGDQIAGLAKWAVASPLALGIIAVTAGLLFLPKLIGGKT